MKTLSIIIPCYNEEQMLPIFLKAVDPIITQVKDYKIDFIFVDDGSKDRTLEVLNELFLSRNDINIVKEARNYGQNQAITAGLEANKSDYVIVMDADLQDPVELIPLICEQFNNGYEVVNPHRASRKEDSFFKRTTAGLFYDVVNTMEKKNIIPKNVNCYRGLSKKAVDCINAFTEKDRYYVSVFPLVGFASCNIEFSRQKRQAGESKYTLDKLFTHAFNIISTATSRPLYFPIKYGAVTSGLFLVSSIILTVFYILGQCSVILPYQAIMVSMLVSWMFFATSLIIFFIGIIALYLHNILINTRNRPDHIVDYIKRPEDKKDKE